MSIVAATKHARQEVKDPERRIGEHLRIFQQTTGGWLVYDERRAPTDRGVPNVTGSIATWTTLDDAAKAAAKMEAAYGPESHRGRWDKARERWLLPKKTS